MRHALAAGAFALSLLGTATFAQAHTQQPSSSIAFTQPSVASDRAVSPDVAEWTSRLIVTTPAKHSATFGRFAGGILARTSKIAELLTHSALRFLGTPYVFGGTTPAGFDCSAFVQHVFRMAGISLPRTADAQYDVGHKAVGGPRPGDLVFFQTYAEGVSHVGIYLGKGKFVHASSSRGVMISQLSESYWASRYLGAKRLIATR